MERIVFHIDVNSAFLSRSAKQVLEKGYKIDIRKIVSVVGVQETRKGFALACSIPAKKKGIYTTMRISDAKKLCPELKVAPPDYEYYKKCSDQMMKIIKSKFKLFQQYSIDECFVEYDEEMQKIYGDPVRVANELREYIEQKCGFTVNVGIGNNKFLAKMASDFEKPNKVHTLYLHEIEEKMRPLPIGELFGCGKKTESLFKKMGINTIGDLAKKDKNLIKAKVGRHGAILHDNAHGIDPTKVENTYDDRKCIGASSITKKDTKDREYILSFFQGFSEILALSLKERGLAGDRLTVHIRYTDFSYKSHQMKLLNPINTVEELLSYGTKLFDELRNLREVNLVGMTISGLQDVRFKQGSLF